METTVATLTEQIAQTKAEYARVLGNLQKRVALALDEGRVQEADGDYLEHFGRELKTLSRTLRHYERVLEDVKA